MIYFVSAIRRWKISFAAKAEPFFTSSFLLQFYANIYGSALNSGQACNEK